MPLTIAKQTLDNNQDLVNQLTRFARFSDLRSSAFYREHKDEIRTLLDEPRVYEFPGACPRLPSFLRVVEWNIERGARLQAIIKVLNSHDVLRFADLLLLNELDDGMVRSYNLNVPFELSQTLEAHAVFGIEYLELTKGTAQEAALPGENSRALHGNAILTRHDFSNREIVQLPRCENNFEAKERRIGGRIGIFLNIEIAGTTLTVANTHLDVVNTPRCRGRQMRAMLEALEERLRAEAAEHHPVIVGGDLNTHTFGRGNRFRAMRNTAIILNSARRNLASRLRRPETREPAIREFSNFGYTTESFNDRRATSRTIVSNLDDTARLPRAVKWWINRRIPREGLLLEFRLDWMAARGLRALVAGEMVDEQTGVASVDAQTIQGLRTNGVPLSDHDPIVFDVAPGNSWQKAGGRRQNAESSRQKAVGRK
ncbi:MAG TPA: endonuclease/exonuclease/phosphatase family protein [Blastocatellia bacterium]|nr:endonuclease/exonuclease/phosphatase family protein [Blastocatellia bacterium]